MVFACAPNFRAKAAAKKQALKQKLAGAGAYHGVSLRLLLVDKQVDAQDVLPHAALGCVHVVKYDAHSTTLAELVALIREAHRQNTAPFLSMAIAQHGADEHGQWAWTSDLTVDLKNMHGAIDQLAPIVEVLAAALSKTTAGKAHIDLLACNLATTCKGLIPALEKMYGIDFRASTDETGNDLSGGDWKMETDNDYDVAADYLDATKLKQYTETMALGGKAVKMQMSKITGKGNTAGDGYHQQLDDSDHDQLNTDPADNEQSKAKYARKAKAKAKKGTAAAVGLALGELVPGLGAVIKINALKCTQTHLANLKKIQTEADNVLGTKCTCGEVEGAVTCVHILDFVIKQKEFKLRNTVVSMVPIVGSANTARRVFKAGYKTKKGTLGGHQDGRNHFATHLFRHCSRNGRTGIGIGHAVAPCGMARSIAAELLGGYTNSDAVGMVTELLKDKDKCIDIFQCKMTSA